MDMVAELRDLLRRADEPGPYVLVGHSYGGLLMRLFAYHHRDEVAGLVLVDSMHEDQFEVFGPLFPPPAPDDPEQLKSIRAFWTTGWRDPASTTEGIDFLTSQREGHQVTSLDDLPLRVMTAGTYLHMPGVPDVARPHLQSLWRGLQGRLAGLSRNVAVTQLDASGHFIQRDDPAAIVSVIRDLVAQVRKPPQSAAVVRTD